MQPTETAQTDQSNPKPVAADDRRHAEKLQKIIRKHSFCTVATTSPAGRSHSAGVIYQAVDGDLWIHTLRSSRKARNIVASGNVGVCLSFRRLPAGPPFTIHYQAGAELLAMDDPQVRRLIAAGAIDRISGHGALEMEDGCFVKISKPRTLHSYGPGASIIGLIRDPLNNGARSVKLQATEAGL